jgi:hypothetical protein
LTEWTQSFIALTKKQFIIPEMELRQLIRTRRDSFFLYRGYIAESIPRANAITMKCFGKPLPYDLLLAYKRGEKATEVFDFTPLLQTQVEVIDLISRTIGHLKQFDAESKTLAPVDESHVSRSSSEITKATGLKGKVWTAVVDSLIKHSVAYIVGALLTLGALVLNHFRH